MRDVCAVLLHYPVLDRERRIVTTAITNLDLHDIARSAHAFGLRRFYVAHPVQAQRTLADRVRSHWTEGSGALRIPDRVAPLTGLMVVESLEAAVRDLGGDGGVELWTTSGSPAVTPGLSFADGRDRLRTEGPPVLIAFGTGWGLADSLHEQARFRLDPIRSARADGFNHLSVRAAAAIVFDRLLGGGGVS